MIAEGFPSELHLTSEDWPEGGDAAPGRHDHFLPQGFLLGAPLVMFPYRQMAPDDYYGAQASDSNPFTNAPLQDSCGGTVYFETSNADSLKALVRTMGIRAEHKAYVAIAHISDDPVKDRYLHQLKIISNFALTDVLKIDEKQLPGEQTLTIEEAIIGFVAAQCHRWNDPNWTFSSKLTGTAGGDGDWAKEALAFGLHVENTYWGAYRVWSRPWLVTK